MWEPHYCVIRTPVGITSPYGHPGHNVWARMCSQLYSPSRCAPHLTYAQGGGKGGATPTFLFTFLLERVLQIKVASRSLCSTSIIRGFPCEPFLWPGAFQTARPQPRVPHSPLSPTQTRFSCSTSSGNVDGEAFELLPGSTVPSPLLAAWLPCAVVVKGKKGRDGK